VVVTAFKKVYFFADARYWRYDIDANRVEVGWPKDIAAEWRRWPTGLPGSANRVSAALNARNGKAYFFFGREYRRFDIALDRMDLGPLKVSDYWPGVGADLFIEAAVNLGNGDVCLFHDRTCTRFNLEKNRALDGYPRRIADDWPGMPDAHVDAALNYGSGSIYFFIDQQYTRFDLATNQRAQPFESIAANWHGLPDARIDDAIEWSDDDFKAACLPIYDPSFWNDDRDVRIGNNCYNYGCNRALPGFSNPGRGSGHEAPSPASAVEYDAGVQFDGLVPVKPDDPDLSGCAHLIMLFRTRSGLDFHFYHRNTDGMWSHKPGHDPARNVDADNKRITDPRTANRQQYVEYCGTYRVDRSKLRLG
jgi:hypothetical protein